MKNLLKISISLILVLMISAFTFDANAEKKGKAGMEFKESLFDFGNIKENGGPVTHEFVFVNNGTAPLVINSARAECGCTKPEFPEQAIAPGKSGVIKVTYNPLGRPGGFTKSVTVRGNGNPGKVVLKIRGTVLPQQ